MFGFYINDACGNTAKNHRNADGDADLKTTVQRKLPLEEKPPPPNKRDPSMPMYPAPY